MRWEPSEPAWQYELLDKLPRSVDVTQLEEALRLSPTERLERVRQLVELAEEIERARGHRLQASDSEPR